MLDEPPAVKNGASKKIINKTDVDVNPGGSWKPLDCQARWNIAIVIPYR